MPSRTPIIPTTLNQRILFNSALDQVQKTNEVKPINKDAKKLNLSSTAEKSFEIKRKKEDTEKMPINGGHVTGNAEAEQSDSCSDGGDSDTSEQSERSEQSDSSYSSIDGEASVFVEPRERQQPKERFVREIERTRARPLKSWKSKDANEKLIAADDKNKVVLSEIDKLQIRRGYERHVVNGERPQTGRAFEAKLPQFRVTPKSVNSAGKANGPCEEITFPLEQAAAGAMGNIELQDAVRIEKATKRKTKMEKRAIAEAKQTVAVAKLREFEVKLRARQAQINERHAKLCHRRAVIKKAEERLQLLESRLDDEEECHRERERRVRNRERRVKQEEAGIQIKEVSLKKREAKISHDLNDIDRRRKLIDEKEAMSQTMQDIVTKQENHYRQQQEKKNKSMPFVRLLRKPGYKNINFSYGSGAKKKVVASSPEPAISCTDGSSSSGSAPVPSPRKSTKGTAATKQEKKRTSSLDSILSKENDVQIDNEKRKTDELTLETAPHTQNKSSIMGLWL